MATHHQNCGPRRQLVCVTEDETRASFNYLWCNLPHKQLRVTATTWLFILPIMYVGLQLMEANPQRADGCSKDLLWRSLLQDCRPIRDTIVSTEWPSLAFANGDGLANQPVNDCFEAVTPPAHSTSDFAPHHGVTHLLRLAIEIQTHGQTPDRSTNPYIHGGLDRQHPGADQSALAGGGAAGRDSDAGKRTRSPR